MQTEYQNMNPYEQEVNLGNIECPVPLNKISKIEGLNDIRINVFGYEEEVFPLYIFEQVDEDCINLLLISHEGNYHYCLICSFSRLPRDLTNHKAAHYYCYRCLHRVISQDSLKEHCVRSKLHRKYKCQNMGNVFLNLKISRFVIQFSMLSMLSLNL